jgi:uncharacterized membrane protein
VNKYRYLDILDSRLQGALPREEYQNVMQYYNEYFADAGMDREAEIIEELGDPEALANRIIADSTGRGAEPAPEKKRMSWPMIIFIAIIGSPLWISLFGVAISVIAVLAALVFSIGIVTAALFFSAVVLFGGGIAYLFTSVPSALVVIGAALICGAVGICMFMLCRVIVIWISGIVNKRKNRKGRESLMKINGKKLWAAAGIMAAVGGILIAVGILNGADKDIKLFHKIDFIYGSELKSKMEYTEMSEFHSVNIDLNAGDIKIVEGKEFAVEYGLYSSNVECYVKNDRLTITETSEKGIGTFGFDFTSQNPSVIVYVPKDMEEAFESLDMKTNMGDVKVIDLTAENVKGETDMGDVELSGIFSGKITADTNMGDVTVEGEVTGSLSIKSDMGDVKATGYLACDIDANTNMGDARVTTYIDASCYDYEVDTDLGEDKVEKKGGEVLKKANFKMKVYSDMGDARATFEDK